jgi:hypothetical protein
MIFRHFPGRTEEKHNRTSVETTGLRAEIKIQDLQNSKQECQPLHGEIGIVHLM